MLPLDLLATQPHYLHHLGPVWAALERSAQGELLTADPARGSRDGAVLVSSAHDLQAAARAGYTRVAYLEHGMGQPYSGLAGYPGGIGRGTVELFLEPNEVAADADAQAYPEAQVLVVGDPRLDTLPAREPGPLRVAVSFHWECYSVPEARSALSHYLPALPALASAYTLLGHGHPRAARKLERVWRRLGVEWVPDFDEVCRRADLYVCDNSSTLFEFASTGRPVLVLNAPWYRRAVEHGLRFWEAATVGVQVSYADQLVTAAEWALEDVPAQRQAREAALRLVYPQRTGAAARAARALEGWL